MAHNIEVRQPTTFKNNEDEIAYLKALAPGAYRCCGVWKDSAAACAEHPLRGCLNVHGSLLPKYRGAAPIQWAVLNGDKITGVTIMQMADGIDTGDMLAKAETPIGEDETAGELFDRLMVLGAELLVDTIDKLDTITPQPQNDAEAIHAPMIRKEMGRNRLDTARRARARPCARFEPVAVRVFHARGQAHEAAQDESRCRQRRTGRNCGDRRRNGCLLRRKCRAAY